MNCQIYNHATCYELLQAKRSCQFYIFIQRQFILQSNIKSICFIMCKNKTFSVVAEI